jgi:hypothetical protein
MELCKNFMRMLSAMAKLTWETITDTTFRSLFSWDVVLHHQIKPNQLTAAWCFDPQRWDHYTVSKHQAPVRVMPCHMPIGTSTVPLQKSEKWHNFLQYTLILIHWIKMSRFSYFHLQDVCVCVCVCIYIFPPQESTWVTHLFLDMTVSVFC